MPLVLTNSGITSGTVNTNAQVFFKSAERTTAYTFAANGAYVDWLTLSFTTTVTSNVWFLLNLPPAYESGAVVGLMRFTLNNSVQGNEFVCYRQTANNTATPASPFHIVNGLAADTYTLAVQMRNNTAGTTLIAPYSHNGSVTRAILMCGIYGS